MHADNTQHAITSVRVAVQRMSWDYDDVTSYGFDRHVTNCQSAAALGDDKC